MSKYGARALSSDLTVLSRVEGAAARLGKKVRIASGGSQAAELCIAGEANTLIVDLSMPSIDIGSLVSQLRQSEDSATRVIAFGPHVHEGRLAAARDAGCDLVVSRGQFFSQVEAILSQ